ncbi:hypothetical protein B7P43_G14786 [Cryptotermes secundus]|uniref:Uncharacterized protein n=1 Tax=Cryptotermes secundus TaxID=105785 RepID=A0A2J7QIU9_9NEOP|nr:hypothetical protein B7P43_G14786 [Cryptotermes secundus]
MTPSLSDFTEGVGVLFAEEDLAGDPGDLPEVAALLGDPGFGLLLIGFLSVFVEAVISCCSLFTFIVGPRDVDDILEACFDSTTFRLLASFVLLAGVAVGEGRLLLNGLVNFAVSALDATPFIFPSTDFLGVVGDDLADSLFFSVGGLWFFLSVDLGSLGSVFDLLMEALSSGFGLDSVLDLVVSVIIIFVAFSVLALIFSMSRDLLSSVFIFGGSVLEVSLSIFCLVWGSALEGCGTGAEMGAAVAAGLICFASGMCPATGMVAVLTASLFVSIVDRMVLDAVLTPSPGNSLSMTAGADLCLLLARLVIPTVEADGEADLAVHTGCFKNSRCFNLSKPSNILC